jgi:putative FmdB family regulatory protein
MPTYEYRCPKGHTFEKFFQTMNDKRRVRCPTCGKSAERIISGGAGLVFKGSGFYITDYKRAGEKQPTEGETKPDAKKPETKAESKSESKTESQSESKSESKPKKDSGRK